MSYNDNMELKWGGRDRGQCRDTCMEGVLLEEC